MNQESPVANLHDWIDDIKIKVSKLRKYTKLYSTMNIIIICILAASTAALGYLESISLGTILADGDISQPISILKLSLIIVSSILTTVVTAINPSKKSQLCYKSAKDYLELRRVLQGKLDRFEMGYYGTDALKKYSAIVAEFGAKEKVIMEESPIIL